MTRPIGTVPAGGGASGGAVETINGLPGPNPVVTASLVPSTGPSTVQADIDALAVAAAQVAGLIVIDSYAALEAAFPNVAGVHTIDQQTLWVSQTGTPIAHPAGFSTVLVHPGSMAAVGPSKVLIVGDVAGPLLSGEIIADGITILNVNPLGSDVSMESLAGRPVSLSNVTLLGQDAGTIANCLGVALVNVAVQPAAPGAIGLVIDGVSAVQRWDSVAAAPGGSPYVAWSVAATATIIADLRFDGCAFFGAGVTGDAMLYVDPLASLPTAALPTDEFGLEVVGCAIKKGVLFAAGGLDHTSIKVLSAVNTGGPTSQFIGSARYDSIGTPPDAILDHAGQPGVALPVPYDNSQAGGVGGTLRTLTVTGANARHTLLIGTVDAATVNAGGTYTGADGDYPATEAATSGTGSGAEFTVTLTGGTITSVVSIDALGSGYEPTDTITLAVVGPTETVAAVLDVNAVAWALRTDGPLNELAGSAAWTVDFERGAGGAGSTVFGFVQRRLAGSGPWVEVDGSRSVPTALLSSPQRVAARVPLSDIGVGDEWRLVWVNDNGSSTQTAFTIIQSDIEAAL